MKIFSSPYYCDEKVMKSVLICNFFTETSMLSLNPFEKSWATKKEETQAQETQKAQTFGWRTPRRA